MTNLDRVAKIFPECVTETEIDGKLTRAINFDTLRQLLSDELVDGRESYEFTFVGKKRAQLDANPSTTKTLRPDRNLSREFDTTQNLYIEGDNLDALKILTESYLGRVKLIYIDPPYNTGNDFIYRDDFKQSESDFDDAAGNVDDDGNRFRNTNANGRFHSDWCAMIYARLAVAKHFLSDDGVIFISIDDHEQATLKLICDELFGEKNFVAQFTWRRRSGANDAINNVSIDHEYVLAYAKDAATFTLNGVVKGFESYANPDDDPRGAWIRDNLTCGKTAAQRPNLFYPITDPKTGITYECNPNRVWSFERDKMLELIATGKVLFPPDGNGRPAYKRHKSEVRSETKPFGTLLDTQL
ncbi:MAG: site-specific DNA-methyltransferase, partial [Selenomonadaceae bacterium]|nr:site-specific DNA-methyltransferase [Selenomonadaceae bacterium]